MESYKQVVSIDPHFVENGDKVRVKGILKSDAHKFSINFAQHSTSSIIYHFKCRVQKRKIVENYKENGDWMGDHIEKDCDCVYTVQPVVQTTTTSDADEVDKTNSNVLAFDLEFAFGESSIYVYNIYDNAHSIVTTYERDNLKISDIKTLHIWGDVKQIKQISIIYK